MNIFDRVFASAQDNIPCQTLWQNDRYVKKNDIFVPSFLYHVVLGKCRVAKSQKIGIELGRGGLDILWLSSLFSKTFMARIV